MTLGFRLFALPLVDFLLFCSSAAKVAFDPTSATGVVYSLIEVRLHDPGVGTQATLSAAWDLALGGSAAHQSGTGALKSRPAGRYCPWYCRYRGLESRLRNQTWHLSPGPLFAVRERPSLEPLGSHRVECPVLSCWPLSEPRSVKPRDFRALCCLRLKWTRTWHVERIHHYACHYAADGSRSTSPRPHHIPRGPSPSCKMIDVSAARSSFLFIRL